MIDLAEQASAGDVRGARHGIDPNAAEVRQVDLHAAVAGRPAGVAVATALDCEQQIALARERDGGADVGDAARLHDQRGMPVDRFVQHATRLVVARLARQQQGATETVPKRLHRARLEGDRRSIAGDGLDRASNARRRQQVARRKARGNRARQRRSKEVASIHKDYPGGTPNRRAWKMKMAAKIATAINGRTMPISRRAAPSWLRPPAIAAKGTFDVELANLSQC